MAESVDATVSNTVGAIHPGSSPGPGTLKRLSNKFGQSLFIVSTGKKNKLKNKAFMLKFSVKAFVMS